jgi:amidophosphoribosyltransferase
MGGFFGVASKSDCTMHLFFGVDYHSHLGTRRGGMAVYGEEGFQKTIHNIQNSPFRTKFENDVEKFKGNIGIGCISDNEAQPLLINSHVGSFAICTVGRINNINELRDECFKAGRVQFLEMNKGLLNPTEMLFSLPSTRKSASSFLVSTISATLSSILSPQVRTVIKAGRVLVTRQILSVD